jgi:hypothetical protein
MSQFPSWVVTTSSNPPAMFPSSLLPNRTLMACAVSPVSWRLVGVPSPQSDDPKAELAFAIGKKVDLKLEMDMRSLL